jgi:hypothetical protein
VSKIISDASFINFNESVVFHDFHHIRIERSEKALHAISDSPVSSTGQALRRALLAWNEKNGDYDTISQTGTRKSIFRHPVKAACPAAAGESQYL